MQPRQRFPWSCALAVAILAGCENSPFGQPEPVPSRPQAAPEATAGGRTAETMAGPAAQPPGTTMSPSSGLTSSPPSAAAPGEDPLSLVRLSAGVALAQTGPTGVLMSFSVDYAFTRAGPDPASRYAWVIRRTNGSPIMQPVELRAEGTLRAFVPGWRPEEGPFESFLLEIRGDGSQRPVSTVVALR
jgi:hypothetical protein